ncbi:cytochrome P450 [Crepidotus variabilis]|uniref:Cytochrome P450 n=1 Tax=Crepidotus variabilis TaxID=179855 RepID=A0A9P6ED14_9AGAR|nr:cytochrome P450 [Crepidotus variabilis]
MRVYHQWAKELGQNLLILDTPKAAIELLEKRSAIYFSRPRFGFLHQVVGPDFSTAALKYIQFCQSSRRKHRCLAHAYFGQNAPASSYKEHSVRAARELVVHLLNTDRSKDLDVKSKLSDTAALTILSICYGITPLSSTSKLAKGTEASKDTYTYYLLAVQNGLAAINKAGIPGKFLADVMPMLKYVPEWMPGAGFQTKARISGTCPPCFACTTLQTLDLEVDEGETSVGEDIVKIVAVLMYAAGSDTTSTTIASCILGLLSRPELLHRARESLDRVIKPGNLPELEDEPKLPFITAIVKEALRWREALPLGVPHQVEVEDEYAGYRIPAGLIIIANQWALLQDEEFYPDPFKFKPERFIKGDEYNYETKDPEYACWGFGRQICPGQFMAFSAIWITIASLIYVFDIEKEVAQDGSEIEPDPEYTSALMFAPESVPCHMTPRSQELARLVRASVVQEL